MRIIRSPYFRRLVLAGAVAVLILGIGAYSYVTRARAAPAQPVSMPHTAHGAPRYPMYFLPYRRHKIAV